MKDDFLGTSYDPFATDGISRFDFPTPDELEVMGDETFFQIVPSFHFIITDDFVIPHLIDLIDLSFH